MAVLREEEEDSHRERLKDSAHQDRIFTLKDRMEEEEAARVAAEASLHHGMLFFIEISVVELLQQSLQVKDTWLEYHILT